MSRWRTFFPTQEALVFGSASEQRDDVCHPCSLCGRGGGLELEGERTLHQECQTQARGTGILLKEEVSVHLTLEKIWSES